MIKSVTVIEVAADWTLDKLGLPTTYRLASDGRPELGVFSYPGMLLDCCVIVDASDQIAAWVRGGLFTTPETGHVLAGQGAGCMIIGRVVNKPHGTDCIMTKAVRASMDEDDQAPHVPECHRRAQGGSFRALPLPAADKRL